MKGYVLLLSHSFVRSFLASPIKPEQSIIEGPGLPTGFFFGIQYAIDETRVVTLGRGMINDVIAEPQSISSPGFQGYQTSAW